MFNIVIFQPGKNMVKDIPIPRYDFYQTPNELILALYIKGYDKLKDEVKVEFGTDSVSSLRLPSKLAVRDADYDQRDAR